MKILITDADYKNSIAIQEDLRRNFGSDADLYAQSESPSVLARWYKYAKPITACLEQAVDEIGPDLVIPVGGRSVQKVSEKFPHLALLPPSESLDIAFDKSKTASFCEENRFPVPNTIKVSTIDELTDYKYSYPVVVKSSNEVSLKKPPEYALTESDWADFVSEYQTGQISMPEAGLLIQEKVDGVGRAFFGLYGAAGLYTYFMHERIRELPITGGASTAAKSIYCDKLFDIGDGILRKLAWRGVAMVEFKYDPVTHAYSLIEINPKFWGSLELAYAAGLSFGSDVARLFLQPGAARLLRKGQPNYELGVEFGWLLDGDLIALRRLGRLRDLRQYCRGRYKTNLSKNAIANIIKLRTSLVSMMQGRD